MFMTAKEFYNLYYMILI